MILSTHAVVGAALASFVPSHPFAAFMIGFASHFALDTIRRPFHWRSYQAVIRAAHGVQEASTEAVQKSAGQSQAKKLETWPLPSSSASLYARPNLSVRSATVLLHLDARK
jgi:hypothetical protein